MRCYFFQYTIQIVVPFANIPNLDLYLEFRIQSRWFDSKCLFGRIITNHLYRCKTIRIVLWRSWNNGADINVLRHFASATKIKTCRMATPSQSFAWFHYVENTQTIWKESNSFVVKTNAIIYRIHFVLGDAHWNWVSAEPKRYETDMTNLIWILSVGNLLYMCYVHCAHCAALVCNAIRYELQ